MNARSSLSKLSGAEHAQCRLLADIVAKVENRATQKISRKLIFELLCRCVEEFLFATPKRLLQPNRHKADPPILLQTANAAEVDLIEKVFRGLGWSPGGIMSSILLRVYVTPFAEKGVEEAAKWSCDSAKEALKEVNEILVKGEYCVCDE